MNVMLSFGIIETHRKAIYLVQEIRIAIIHCQVSLIMKIQTVFERIVHLRSYKICDLCEAVCFMKLFLFCECGYNTLLAIGLSVRRAMHRDAENLNELFLDTP